MTWRAPGALVVGLLLLAGCSSEVSGAASPAPVVGGATPTTSSGAPTEDNGGAEAGTVACEWVPDGSGDGVGTPPDEVPAEGTTTLVLTLGQGDLTLTLDAASAPCAAASTAFLAQEGFFDGSPCHRLVDSSSFGVLQCGDPTGTGTGGPGYRFAQEVTEDTSYPAGTVAMANSGRPESTGSQFFLCFVDTQLSPDYTVVGTLDAAGLDVVREIAAAGHDGSLDPSPGGGAPNEPVVVESARVTA
ncbi:peptidylprolyl isomerase [Trujillonella endophytica]|uniref:Peptidyl-prolyl cis-trans isomerase B (Cyclophilin B) n=1 Tax=Trujillonella endophytica TaxID=673521 RepID=A0A1H8TXV6_9ACTN|nr:peptidylprolyl isomerase [Trujillella endophytica]SEO95819.1 peptidyl-prolyl cis-trans isomerase B (cyclophilin B) [Trujillella endophytica]